MEGEEADIRRFAYRKLANHGRDVARDAVFPVLPRLNCFKTAVRMLLHALNVSTSDKTGKSSY